MLFLSPPRVSPPRTMAKTQAILTNEPCGLTRGAWGGSARAPEVSRPVRVVWLRVSLAATKDQFVAKMQHDPNKQWNCGNDFHCFTKINPWERTGTKNRDPKINPLKLST